MWNWKRTIHTRVYVQCINVSFLTSLVKQSLFKCCLDVLRQMRRRIRLKLFTTSGRHRSILGKGRRQELFYQVADVVLFIHFNWMYKEWKWLFFGTLYSLWYLFFSRRALVIIISSCFVYSWLKQCLLPKQLWTNSFHTSNYSFVRLIVSDSICMYITLAPVPLVIS